MLLKPNTLTFEQCLDLPVAAADAFAWHARPGAFDRLTPPWLETEIVQDSHGIETGSRLIFRVRRGPLWVRWIAEHQDTVAGKCFTDVQISGPFAFWRHVHSFATIDSGSRLSDQIEYALPFGALSHPLLGRFLQADLERMFAFRHRTTLADLELHHRHAGQPQQHVLLTGGEDWLARPLAAVLSTGGHKVTRSRPDQRPSALPSFDAWVTLAALKRRGLDDAGLARLEQELDAEWRSLREKPRTFVLLLPMALGASRSQNLINACARILDTATRCVILRCGEVLWPAGGWLAQKTSWRLASGNAEAKHLPKAPKTWISLDDVAAGTLHAILKSEIHGAIGLNADKPLDPAWESTGFQLRHPDFVFAMRHFFGLKAPA